MHADVLFWQDFQQRIDPAKSYLYDERGFFKWLAHINAEDYSKPKQSTLSVRIADQILKHTLPVKYPPSQSTQANSRFRSEKMKYKFGLLTYDTNNIGDEIQSIAARQFLPKIDIYLNRDYLCSVRSKHRIKVIMNGWFTSRPENWPPAPVIDPLFVSFHITKSASKKLTSPESISYFRKHEPIGCRDYYTRDLLRDKGVDAYFSGCLTLTLEKKSPDRKNRILIVDLNEGFIEGIPPYLLKKFENVSHYVHFPIAKNFEDFLRKNCRTVHNFMEKAKLNSFLVFLLEKTLDNALDKATSAKKKFRKAESLLYRYCEAKLVVTSRLHAALPCLAYNTPVIFVHENLNNPRFKGYLKYLRTFSSEEFKDKCKEIDWNGLFENPGNIYKIRKRLEKTCKNFMDLETLRDETETDMPTRIMGKY